MKTLIAVPAMGWVYTEFLQALLELDKPDAHISIQKNSLIYDSRNNLAWAAVSRGYDRVLWLDSDMSFDPDLLTQLNADMDENGLDYVCGVFTQRNEKRMPCIYYNIHWENTGTKLITSATPVQDVPAGLFEIAGSGFGAVLTKTAMLKAVGEEYGLPFMPMPGLGEDLAFCWRAKQLGYKMYCDGRIDVGHIGQFTYRRQANV